MTKLSFSRRDFLRSSGVALALPLLEAMRMPLHAAGTPNPQRRRMVAIMTPLGIHSEYLFPEKAGRDYEPSMYLQALQPVREKFTVFSGLSHPGVDGGHDAERSFLTAAPHPGQASFRNTISLDQLAAERIGGVTRFDSLTLSTLSGSISWTRGGVQIPSEFRPSKLFAKLFLDGTAKEIDQQVAQLKQGKSVLDAVNFQAKRYAGALGQRDKDKLDEYFTSVRELEQKMTSGEEWARKPKPKVAMAPPVDIQDNADLIGRTRMMYDLMHLALQTDSTRVMTLMLQGTGLVPHIEGVTTGHHDLSHHGKDPEKLRQLGLLEAAEFGALAEFLLRLENTKEPEGTLLDGTMVLFGSNLGNASSHSTQNMPMVMAGGGFQHGQHLAFDAVKPPALGKLYVQMLQRLGIETDEFANAKGGLPGFTA